MNKPLEMPADLTMYMLLQQSSTSLYFTAASSSHTTTFGTGFYGSREDAEKARTMAILADKTNNYFHIFELTVPNPAYKKTS